MSSTLIVHRGAIKCTREQVAAAPVPEATKSFFPVSHIDVLTTVERQLAANGFTVASEQHAMHGVTRYFGTLDLSLEVQPDIRVSVALVNSVDMSLSMRFLAGNRVFCCDNLSLSSDLMPAISRKHTRNGRDRYTEALTLACKSLPVFQAAEAKRITFMKENTLQPYEGEAWLLKAFEEDILFTRTLPDAIKQFREPQFDWGCPRDSLWFLFNCITTSMQARAKTNPAVFAAQSLRIWEMIGPKGYDSPSLIIDAPATSLHETNE